MDRLEVERREGKREVAKTCEATGRYSSNGSDGRIGSYKLLSEALWTGAENRTGSRVGSPPSSLSLLPCG